MAVMTGTTWSPTKIASVALIAREATLVLASRYINKDQDFLSMGRVLQVPEVAELANNPVGADGSYIAQAPAQTVKTLTVNQFRHSAFSVRVDLDAQSALDLKKNFAPKIGYALAKYLEQRCHSETQNITQAIDVTRITDTELRRAEQYLSDADAPEMDRCIVFSPGDKNDILNIDKFVQAQILGVSKSQALLKGQPYSIYGMEPSVSTVVPTRSISSTLRRVCVAFQKEFAAKATQKEVKLVVKEPRLAVDYIGWQLFGTTTTRANHGVVIRTTANAGSADSGY